MILFLRDDCGPIANDATNMSVSLKEIAQGSNAEAAQRIHVYVMFFCIPLRLFFCGMFCRPINSERSTKTQFVLKKKSKILQFLASAHGGREDGCSGRRPGAAGHNGENIGTLTTALTIHVNLGSSRPGRKSWRTDT